MAKVHFTDEFKRDAVAQIVERGYLTQNKFDNWYFFDTFKWSSGRG